MSQNPMPIADTNAAPGTSLTAVGLLCRYDIDKWSPVHPGMGEGVSGLVKNGPRYGEKLSNLYYYYYATQVVHFFAGDEWKDWNEGKKEEGVRKGGMRDWLIELQFKKDGDDQGSWEPEDGIIGLSCGRLGTTALALLTLEVYYRYLPLYKRGIVADREADKR